MRPYSNEASLGNMSVLVLCQVATNQTRKPEPEANFASHRPRSNVLAEKALLFGTYQQLSHVAPEAGGPTLPPRNY